MSRYHVTALLLSDERDGKHASADLIERHLIAAFNDGIEAAFLDALGAHPSTSNREIARHLRALKIKVNHDPQT